MDDDEIHEPFECNKSEPKLKVKKFLHIIDKCAKKHITQSRKDKNRTGEDHWFVLEIIENLSNEIKKHIEIKLDSKEMENAELPKISKH